MYKEIYEHIYRLWSESIDFVTIGYDRDGQPIDISRVSNPENLSIWTMGVKVWPTNIIKGREFTLGSLATDLGAEAPQNYAEIFTGDFDIIKLFQDEIWKYILECH